jgi:hypothetical protein
MKLTRKRLTVAVGGTALATAGVLFSPITASQAVTPAVTTPAHADVFFVNSGPTGGTTKAFPAGSLSNHNLGPDSGSYTVILPAGFVAAGDTTKCSTVANTNVAATTATAQGIGGDKVNVNTFSNATAIPTAKDIAFDLIIVC